MILTGVSEYNRASHKHIPDEAAMANKEQLEILKQGVEVWNEWRKVSRGVLIDLREADLEDADLPGADLRYADLRQAHLARVNLREAVLAYAYLLNSNLHQADLEGAEMTRADLLRANLTGARLKMTRFFAADLGGADLTGADLAGALLIQADLTGANLRQADFTGSQTGNTVFGDNDLGSTLGLERIEHHAPSTIGTNTINRSKGKIPVEFLRGCGLSDVEIEFAKLAAPGLDTDQVTQIVYEIHRLYCSQPIQFYSCFISYSSQDQAFAQRLHDDLQNHGVRCWFAPEDMKIGDEFRKAIGKEIRVRDKLLIILSQNSIRSEWVGDEVEKALAEEKEQGAPKLFPIRLDNAVFETKDDWAEKIRLRRHIGDFSSDYDKAFQRLLRDLKPQ
jgi:uncharacterized protein YjbI with pentapeptide repeats